MTERGICVVTHPLGPAGENATRTLLDILAELGTVTLITADLPVGSLFETRETWLNRHQKESTTEHVSHRIGSY